MRHPFSTVLALAGLVFTTAPSALKAAPPQPFSLDDIRAVIARTAPGWDKHFQFTLTADQDRHDHFVLSTRDKTVFVTGNSPSALLSGIGWYLKYYANFQVSPNGGPMPLPTVVKALPREESRRSSVLYRYALNQNTDGYSSPYWEWPRWEHELDVYALAGINTMLVERATEAVITRTFTQFGYSDAEIRAKLAMPAHLNWQLMGNLCCFGGPPSQDLLNQRIAFTQRLLARMRSLGMKPALPGYYGMVPSDFAKRFPKAHVISQGLWNGFERPAWLDPRDPLFPRIAHAYYKAQHDLFGDADIYDLELFQEGGNAGDVPLHPAVTAIENSLQEAHPGARWMILGWKDQPAKEILETVPHDRMFVVDLHQNAVRVSDRGADLLGADYVYGGIWNYGGRTTLGGEAEDYGERLPTLPAKQPSMIGMAIFPEAIDNNPYLFDLFSEAAWHDSPVGLQQWTRSFADRRYGQPDRHTEAAWQGLLRTVYSKRPEEPGVRIEEDAASFESLFNAEPLLTARNVFQQGSADIYYDFEALHAAMDTLLQAPARFDASTAYRYDVVDVTRQVLANTARVLLPKIDLAYRAKDLATFKRLTSLWLKLMDKQDRLLGTDATFRVGTWLAYPANWTSVPEEQRRLSYDARSLLTSWGDREVSTTGGLHDYANKDWQGLTGDYYKRRWEIFFASLETSLRDNTPPVHLDWYPVADQWNRQTNLYSGAADGNPRSVALDIARYLEHDPETAILR